MTIPEAKFKDLQVYYARMSKEELVRSLKFGTSCIQNGRGIAQLPPHIELFANFKIISAVKNNISVLPEGIGKLKHLTLLDLTANRIKEMPDFEPGSIEQIILDHNLLDKLPDSFCNLRWLKQLSANDNNLREIPDRIGNLIKLKVLSLQSNNLTALPDSLSELTRLQYLNLMDNKIEVLPSLKKCVKLKTLLLFMNPIAENDSAIAELQKQLPNCKICIK